MAAALKRPNKRKPSAKRAPALTQHIVVDKANVTVSGLAYEKFKGWVPLFTGLAALGAAILFVWNAWTWLGLPKVVAESTFHDTLKVVETKLRGNINETKTEVIDHSNKNTSLVKEDVSKVSQQVGIIADQQRKAGVLALEIQERQLFLQRSNLNNSISSVELQLRERPNDPFLTQRKAELESFLKNVDRETEAVRDQVRRAKQ